jgi:hypothetical protein
MKADASTPNRSNVVRTARARLGDIPLPLAPILNSGMNLTACRTCEPDAATDQVVLMAS